MKAKPELQAALSCDGQSPLKSPTEEALKIERVNVKKMAFQNFKQK